MDISREFVTKVIDEGRIKDSQRAGITPQFLDADSAEVFAYIQRHYTQYKSVPTRDAVKRSYPNFELNGSSQPLEYYIDQIKEGHWKDVLEHGLSKAADVYQKDVASAREILRDTISELNTSGQSFKDANMALDAADRVKAYEHRKKNPGATGILSNWPRLDYQTLGWQKEDFIVLVGEKYMGKSWILLWNAVQAALQNQKVLIATSEMSQEAVVRRMDAIYAQVPFDSLRRGELTHAEEKRYRERMEELSKRKDFSVTVVREGVQTIADTENKAVEIDADIIFGDSIYLFSPDHKANTQGETSKRLEISRKCKAVARNLGIPFVVSVQAGRKKTKSPQKPDLDNIEWSNAFSQDADTVFYLQKDDLDRELKRAQIWLLKSRDGDLDNFFIHQNFQDMDFSQREDTDQPTTDVFEDDEETVFG